jgi:hypothetical protein
VETGRIKNLHGKTEEKIIRIVHLGNHDHRGIIKIVIVGDPETTTRKKKARITETRTVPIRAAGPKAELTRTIAIAIAIGIGIATATAPIPRTTRDVRINPTAGIHKMRQPKKDSSALCFQLLKGSSASKQRNPKNHITSRDRTIVTQGGGKITTRVTDHKVREIAMVIIKNIKNREMVPTGNLPKSVHAEEEGDAQILKTSSKTRLLILHLSQTRLLILHLSQTRLLILHLSQTTHPTILSFPYSTISWT